VICATGNQHFVLTREGAEHIAAERNRVAMLIFDISIPRSVDPEVRRVDGILLYDYEGLDRSVRDPVADADAVHAEAERTVMAEVEAFRARLKAEVIVPTSVVLSQRLNEICRQELELFARERGPLTRDQDQLLRAFTAQIGQKIASSLAREIKELPTEEEQERLAAAATRLFRLESPRLAETKSEPEKLEPKERVVASNY